MLESRTLPIILYASKRRMVRLLVTSLAFVAGGILMRKEQPLVGVACAIVFGVGAVVFAVSLHPRASYLELTDKGFAFASLFRRAFVPWSHVTGFVPVRVQLNNLVGWNYAASFEGKEQTRKLSTAIAGVEAALPDTYGMSASELADLLNNTWLKCRRGA